jgi:tRNA (guanine-N7-)-methyltransferase
MLVDDHRVVEPFHRLILRSFVSQRAKQTKAQTRALEILLPVFEIKYENTLLDFSRAFGREADTVFEIGFGMGEATALMAQQAPEKNFLALEVFPAGVGSLLLKIEELELRNVRILMYDAVDVLEHMIPQHSLSGVHVFFPDPWPKKRHHKRRLIQPLFLDLLTTKIKEGGYLHCATDWPDYAAHMLRTAKSKTSLPQAVWQNHFSNEIWQGTIDSAWSDCFVDLLEKESSTRLIKGFSPRPTSRPLTKYEQRGLRLGHPIFDLFLHRTFLPDGS